MITNYNEYLSLIKEGLIRTHSIIKYSNILETELNSFINEKDYRLDISSKFKFTLELLNIETYSQTQLDGIVVVCNNLGYYPSYIKVENINGLSNSVVYDYKYLSNKYKSLVITFESKYEDGLYSNDLEIPDVAYHLTHQKNIKKINDNGLIPKAYNRKSKHPDRIYMFYDIDDYKSLLDVLKRNDIKNGVSENYVLLEVGLVDKYMNKTKNSIIIHSDPNYLNGFYTYDNIAPYSIKILKEKL